MKVDRNLLEQLNDSDLIELHNKFCYEANYTDDIINDNNEYFINEVYNDSFKAIEGALYGNYRTGDTYVKFDGYGNLNSFNDPNEVIDFADLENWLNDNYYDNQDLDVWEETDEEE